MQDFPTQAQQIRLAVRRAGRLAVQLSNQQFEVSQKGPDDFVTSVDRTLDRQLTTQFATWFANDGVITEENSQSIKAFHQDYARLWLIDPLDGTDDFIQGKPAYAVMVGLLQNYQPLAGWVYAPVSDQLYFGGPNWGLFHTAGDGDPQVFVPQEPAKPSRNFCPVLVGYKDRLRYGAAIREVIPEAQFYSLGSFGLKVLEVIQGRAGLYLYLNGRVKLWDTTGPLALAQAAGLICCDLAGHPIGFTPDLIDPETLSHHQPILVGWPSYIESLLPRLTAAIALATA